MSGDGSPQPPRRGVPAMLWGALGLVAVVVFVLVIWSLRPTPGVGDAATVAVPPEPAVKLLPDAEPVTR